MGKPPALQSNKIWIFRVFWKQVPKIYDFPECLWENSLSFFCFTYFTQINRKRIHSLFQTRFKNKILLPFFSSSHRIVINNFTIEKKFKRFLYLFSFSPSLSRTSLFFLYLYAIWIIHPLKFNDYFLQDGSSLETDALSLWRKWQLRKKKKKVHP